MRQNLPHCTFAVHFYSPSGEINHLYTIPLIRQEVPVLQTTAGRAISTQLKSCQLMHSCTTILRCRWQTRNISQCLALTVLYTDVDGQCDKLVTDDGHQFTTLIVHRTGQHLRRSAVPESHQNLKLVHVTSTTPLSGMLCPPCASTCYGQRMCQIWRLYVHPLQRYKRQLKCGKWGGLGN